MRKERRCVTLTLRLFIACWSEGEVFERERKREFSLFERCVIDRQQVSFYGHLILSFQRIPQEFLVYIFSLLTSSDSITAAKNQKPRYDVNCFSQFPNKSSQASRYEWQRETQRRRILRVHRLTKSANVTNITLRSCKRQRTHAHASPMITYLMAIDAYWTRYSRCYGSWTSPGPRCRVLP